MSRKLRLFDEKEVSDLPEEIDKKLFTEKEKIQNCIIFIMNDMKLTERSVYHCEILLVPVIASIVGIISLLNSDLKLTNLLTLEIILIIIGLMHVPCRVIKSKYVMVIRIIYITIFIGLFIWLLLFNPFILILAIPELILIILFLGNLRDILLFKSPILKKSRLLLKEIILGEYKSSKEIMNEYERIRNKYILNLED